ncbi:type 2 isopentenyl-diphosphate Delta-isomerase [Candidatus Micrarchaeota archaeon CG08_land_8_20_14_0_20_49_17]|nr:MAG: type 2 isopentenyl-diphosphate Delta-isomerase [Candidatus Micrarchaeota archaeon CG1_02_49_24]PIU10089.1 MAG: type 2 isopentenyl-diphosphate Delta-isomerase [Candidatus Micrarchaeota archaeon CG08_land_8_20_14_0_20_49_17]PIZ92367.1 MAG: type 2 isopentenyl-diphosphate Delta-isomerase [Candidatus Micrarchaeota archaeon CG_4_10_14_0_2_um_filter_49_7]HII53667.1 type 2 isopentenyl-diphosphate Delta-isomerase [Candidatus Micrarchaeota archaeon]
MTATQTEKRKGEHVEICRSHNIEYTSSGGFGDVSFIHCSLPELDLGKIDITTKFLGKKLKAPLIITGMTGGYPEAGKTNKKLAAAAEKEGCAFAVGSQRAMVENPKLTPTYDVRKVAPTIPVIANIGIYQLKKYDIKTVKKLVEDISADALAIHLNPLQEAIQPEGDRNFTGCLRAIGNVCSKLDCPVIAKETGAGISREVSHELKQAGVKFIDVSGSGGTSWSKVESHRKATISGFGEWGNPTVRCICECAKLIDVIATGGVRNGLNAAKGIALGAKMAGAALPFLKAKDPQEELALWKQQLKVALFLTASKDLEALRSANLLIMGRQAEELFLRGIDVARYANRRKN